MTEHHDRTPDLSSERSGVLLCSKCQENERAPRGSWCRECRREAQKAYNDRTRPRPQEREKACEECGTRFVYVTGRGPEGRFCCKPCNDKHQNRIKRQRALEEDPEKQRRAARVAERKAAAERHEKRCNACQEMLPWREFHLHKHGTFGLQPNCKICSRKMFIERKYPGMTPEQAEAYAQTDGCQICGDSTKTLHIDHDHTTGAVRGFLCENCNRGLGMFKDDPALLRAAADYLERP